MVQKVALALLGFLAVVALGGLIIQFRDTLTGQYVVSGGGNWYYGAQKAQMEPYEACVYAGFAPIYPQLVYNNEYGTQLSVCRNGNQYVSVPTIQTIIDIP